MSRSTPPVEDSFGEGSDDRVAGLLAEHALFGLSEAEREELEALGVDPASDPRALELELAAAELLVAFREEASHEDALGAGSSRGAGEAKSQMPASLRMKVQAQAFQHFERAHAQPQVAPNTTTGANVVELASRGTSADGPRHEGGGRRTLLFLAAAAAAFLVIGVELFRADRGASGPVVATSAREKRVEVKRVEEIRLEADDVVTDPAVGHSVLRWERGSTRGTLDVHGLPAAEAGRKREVWIVAGGTKKHVGDFASGDAHVLLTSTTPEIDVEAWMVTEDPPTERVILKNRPLGEGPR